MADKRDRAVAVKADIRSLREHGYSIKEAVVIVAERYLMSDRTVKGIWYS